MVKKLKLRSSNHLKQQLLGNELVNLIGTRSNVNKYINHCR